MSPSRAGSRLRAMTLVWRRQDELTDGQRRTARVLRSAGAAGLAHGAGIAVALAAVPLAVGALGVERYGAWAAIGSLLAWLRVADLGIANGLTTNLAAAWGRGDKADARRWVSNALATLAAFAAVLGILLAVLALLVDFGAALNVAAEDARGEVRVAVALAFALLVLELPLSPLERVFGGLNEGPIWNLWAFLGHMASLAGVVAVTSSGGGLVWLVAAFSGFRLIVLVAAATWLFTVRHPWLLPSMALLEPARVRALGRVGGLFFFIQAAALVLYNTDNLVIARVLGASQVTPYAVAWRLFLVPPAAMALAFPYLWAAYAEAVAGGDGRWVRRTLRASVAASAGVGLLLAVLLVATGRPLIGALAGAEAVPSLALLAWMGAWSFLLSWMNAVACFLNAMGRLRVQALFGCVGAVANVALSVVWAKRYGTEGVIAATVVTYVLLIIGPSLLEARRAVRLLPTGSPGATGTPS